jgi:3'-5' exoribonuclease
LDNDKLKQGEEIMDLAEKIEATRLSSVTLSEYLGNTVDVSGVLDYVDIKPQKTGGNFASIKIRDKDVKISLVYFNVTEDIIDKLKVGNVYMCNVSVKTYNNSLSLVVSSIEKLQVDAKEFMNLCKFLPASSMKLREYMERIKGSIYGEFVEEIYKCYMEEIVFCVGGLTNHHTAIGDLVFHIVSVCEAAVKLGEMYNSIYGYIVDLDLLIAGALIHDIGKIFDFVISDEGVVQYEARACLSGHIVAGIEELAKAAVRLDKDTRSEEYLKLRHLIASHHGKLEFGSPVEPATPEAFILHTADITDAEMWRYYAMYKETKPGESVSKWYSGKLVSRYHAHTKNGNDV